MSEEHLAPQFPDETPVSRTGELDFHKPQVIQDLYFLKRTDLQGDQRGLWDFYVQFTGPRREELLRSFASSFQQDSPLTFIRLVEQTEAINTRAARRNTPPNNELLKQWQEWKLRMYREYPPLLFPGEEGNRRWEHAVNVMNRVWEQQPFR